MTRFLYLTTALAAMLTLGAPAAPEVNGLHLNGPALDGRRVATPDLAGRRIDHRRLSGYRWEIRPVDQRWPHSGRNWLVRQ